MVWVAYWLDHSTRQLREVRVFADELSALRYAVEHGHLKVRELENGEDLCDYLIDD